MTGREITEAQLEALRLALKLRGLKHSPLSSEHVATAEVVLARAGRATPPGSYLLVDGQWRLTSHAQSELLRDLAAAGRSFLITLARSGVECGYSTPLGKAAQWLERNLRAVPGCNAPLSAHRLPWQERTIDDWLDAVVPKRGSDDKS